jgi:hypothetical protein
MKEKNRPEQALSEFVNGINTYNEQSNEIQYPDYYLYYDDDGNITEASAVLVEEKPHIHLESDEAYHFMTNENISKWKVDISSEQLQQIESNEGEVLYSLKEVNYLDLNDKDPIYIIDNDPRTPRLITKNKTKRTGKYYQ